MTNQTESTYVEFKKNAAQIIMYNTWKKYLTKIILQKKTKIACQLEFDYKNFDFV